MTDNELDTAPKLFYDPKSRTHKDGHLIMEILATIKAPIKALKRIGRRLIFRLRADYTTEQLVEMGLVVGDNFLRMHGAIIDPSHCWHIHIGNNVTLAPRVHILAHDASLCHHLGYAKIGNVVIGDNVFIGAETVVLPGVTIGNNCIIGANSTVSRNIPAGSVAVGSPARVVCKVSDYVERNKKLMQTRPVYGEEYSLRSNPSMQTRRQMFDDLQDGPGFIV